MKRLIITILALIFTILLAPLSSQACFDTYLFQQKTGMVYPYGRLAFDTNGEYILPDIRSGSDDLFTGSANVYYGLVRNISVQLQFAASENERRLATFDDIGFRAVYGLYRTSSGHFTQDIILEHHVATDNSHNSFELSSPSIWYSDSMTYVVHPVIAFEENNATSLRGHGGIFYKFDERSLIGIGGEYESAQSSTQLGQRLIDGSTGCSLFLGTKLGSALYLQNEFIKGLGAGKDFRYSVTVKFIK